MIRGTQYVTDHIIIAQLKTEIRVASVFRGSVIDIDYLRDTIQQSQGNPDHLEENRSYR